MITVFPQSRLPNPDDIHTKNWQICIREAITNIDELCEILKLPAEFKRNIQSESLNFPLKVPRGFVGKMKVGDTKDPLLLQVLPFNSETIRADGYNSDPVSDLNYNPEHGIIHKYHGRVLLITTGACAIHCRYCFRREFPYSEQIAAKKQWKDALTYIANNDSIHEVILSGGDPLSLSDNKLAVLIRALNEIAHVKTIRFHTRQPLVLPERIDDSFIKTLSLSQKKLVFVLHANHANELCETVARVIKRLKIELNAALLNQSVLLKGINDSADILNKLSLGLHDLDILPYYLNLLDKVHGTSHFYVSDQTAIQIHTKLQQSLPGYLVPKLVRDEGNTLHKTHIS